MEVNMALHLYKSLVTSRINYGIFLCYPNTKKLSLKLEKAQFLEIRAAFGFINQTMYL